MHTVVALDAITAFAIPKPNFSRTDGGRCLKQMQDRPKPQSSSLGFSWLTDL